MVPYSCVFSRVLIGVTESSSAEGVSSLLSSTGVDLLISRVLSSANGDGVKYAESVQTLYLSHSPMNLAWSLGRPAEGHLASVVGPALVQLYQMMLLTLPGTPFINYGDEIGLVDEVRTPSSFWDGSFVIFARKGENDIFLPSENDRTYFWFIKRFMCFLYCVEELLFVS